MRLRKYCYMPLNRIDMEYGLQDASWLQEECKVFVEVVKGECCTNNAALANRAYFYRRVAKDLYDSFVLLIKKTRNEH